MVEFRADLHCHTNCSDGTDAPEAVVRKAAELGLQGLSITDHDTIDAYSSNLFLLAEELQIQLLAGIELSSEWEKTSVHILGYGIDLQSSSLRSFLTTMVQRRRERNKNIVQKLKNKGFAIELEEIEQLGFPIIGRPHIAGMMIKKGYVKSTREAFDRYLKDGASCYASGIKFTPKEVIDHIHSAKGKAILAHPHFLPKGSFLREILKLPLDGLEGYYGLLHPFQEKPWIDLAKERNWIVTGGSDYHGSVKPDVFLGASWTSYETFISLKP